MRIRAVLVLALMSLLCARPGSAQTVPVIRAHSRVVTITDGLHLKKNYWYVMPERDPTCTTAPAS